MKSGAEVLPAGVRVDEEVFPSPLPVGACFCFVAAFFFEIPDVGVLAGAFLAGVFRVLAMS